MKVLSHHALSAVQQILTYCKDKVVFQNENLTPWSVAKRPFYMRKVMAKNKARCSNKAVAYVRSKIDQQICGEQECGSRIQLMREMMMNNLLLPTWTIKLTAQLHLKQAALWFDTSSGAESLLRDLQHTLWKKTHSGNITRSHSVC